MEPTSALVSQFRASLRMLRTVVEICPEELWTDERFTNPTWLLVYHTLFYTHIYLSPSEQTFVPWEKTREDLQFMDALPWPPHEKIERGNPFSRDDLLGYASLVDSRVESLVLSVPFESESGFDWIPFSRFELHLYNLRHVQHHTGQLIERLRVSADRSVAWVGMVAPNG